MIKFKEKYKVTYFKSGRKQSETFKTKQEADEFVRFNENKKDYSGFNVEEISGKKHVFNTGMKTLGALGLLGNYGSRLSFESVEDRIDKYLEEHFGKAPDPRDLPKSSNIDYSFDDNIIKSLRDIFKREHRISPSYSILEIEKEFTKWLSKQDMRKFKNMSAKQIWDKYNTSIEDINVSDLFK